MNEDAQKNLIKLNEDESIAPLTVYYSRIKTKDSRVFLCYSTYLHAIFSHSIADNIYCPRCLHPIAYSDGFQNAASFVSTTELCTHFPTVRPVATISRPACCGATPASSPSASVYSPPTVVHQSNSRLNRVYSSIWFSSNLSNFKELSKNIFHQLARYI